MSSKNKAKQSQYRLAPRFIWGLKAQVEKTKPILGKGKKKGKKKNKNEFEKTKPIYLLGNKANFFVLHRESIGLRISLRDDTYAISQYKVAVDAI